MAAVRLGHVVAVNDSVASEWGPHSIELFFAAIAQAIIEKRVPDARVAAAVHAGRRS
jgi:hypothetical protein